MPTSTVEDYVKAIYLLAQESPTGEATVARLAASLGVTKGTVTAMVRKLREAGLAEAERYGGITLRPKGERLAIDMLRRHRLVEVFLVETLGLDWAEVHDEAERLEHALSAKVIDRLDVFLGRPAIDPHGDPIPDAHGKLAPEEWTALSALDAGACGTIARIADQDAGFLDFAATHGMKPGARVRVVEVVPAAGTLRVRVGRRAAIGLSLSAASRVLVDPDQAPP